MVCLLRFVDVVRKAVPGVSVSVYVGCLVCVFRVMDVVWLSWFGLCYLLSLVQEK